MYKCSDCGKEFIDKPEFCDCGNIFFEQIKEEQKNKEDNSMHHTNRINTENKKNIDTLSVIIFIICIFLSILSLIFIGKDNSDNTEKAVKNSNSIKINKTNNIPSIDKIWKEEIIQKTVQETPQENESFPASTKKTQVNKKNITAKQTTKTEIKNQIKQSQKNISKNKIESQNAKKNETQKKTEAQKQQINSLPIDISIPVKPQTDTASMKKELSQYKIELRNKIASDINFTNIIGDGKCIVSFKIDSNGKLINRTFLQQSDNDSLNDEVYSAVIKNPAYKNPPAIYNNETLKLSVKIYGGQFEVTLN